jgi:hypothetical protein
MMFSSSKQVLSLGFSNRAETDMTDRLQTIDTHVVCVVVDDEQAITQSMRGGDIDWTPKVKGHVQKGTGWFRASSGVPGCNSDLVEQA